MTLALDQYPTADTADAGDTVRPACATASPVPAVLGSDLRVPLVTGELAPYANLDHAASAPCSRRVRDAVDELLPWYASAHRGAGFASQVSTKVYEQSRQAVAAFAGARRGDEVIFTRNTTDSLNLLARCLPPQTSVVLFDTEHHAALLPWRGAHVRRIPAPGTRDEAVQAIRAALAACPEGPRLVVIAGASNVTGELLPVARIAAAAREYGARTVLDAAQLAPHRAVSLRELDVDYVALSGHKLYAPFGAGALVGRADWLHAAQPYLAGGGASKVVSSKETDSIDVGWNLGPGRHEAGSPNTVGAYALGVACTELTEHRAATARHEARLLRKLRAGFGTVPGLTQLRLFDDPDSLDGPDPQAVGTVPDAPDPQAVGTVLDGLDPQAVGTVAFVLAGHEPGWVAAVLSAEYGIGVRDGAFCAHIATRRLTGKVGAGQRQAIRARIGIGTTDEHVERLIRALREIVAKGARWTYAVCDGKWTPSPDPRQLPPFLE